MIINIFHNLEEVTNSVKYYLGNRNGINVVTKDIADIEFPRFRSAGVVLAGNSFGLMDGGIDAAAAKRWKHIQEYIQNAIAEQFFGELPVGCAITVKGKQEHIIYAPTMQVPMVLIESASAFYATLAALREAKAYGLTELWIPMMGCGAGELTVQDGAMQIANAITMMQESVKGKDITWDFAWKRHGIWHEMCRIPPDPTPSSENAEQ